MSNDNSNNNDTIKNDDIQHRSNNSSGGGGGGGISSYSFEKLLREPNQIIELKNNTVNEMQKLALDHYKLFIENYTTLNYTVSKIQNVSHQIENGLLNSLPNISSSCESFSNKSHQLTDRRSSIKNLLDNFPTLLDILEIPQLMDTCIKNNSFDEALQLESFSKKIYKQYSTNSVIIEIMKEIKVCTRSLITTLQQQLRQDIALTNCIKTIGYLRRLSIYKENELKIIFLHSRDQWLINSLKFEIIDSNHVTYLTKLTDTCRTNIFDIVTQYNAIFSNESNDEDQLDDLILFNWVQQKIKIYITIVDTTLNQIKSGSSIAYVLENSMYFSMSISRVGIDFRNLLEPIFEKHILNNFVSQITTASHHFLETLKTYKFPIQKSTTTTTTTTATTTTPNSNNSNSTSQYISPPLSILQHQPLAVLVNLILKSFNELKDCFPISLRSITALKLKESIITIIGGVTSFYNQQLSNTISNLVNNSSSSSSSSSSTVFPNNTGGVTSFDKVFHSFCKCLAEDFIPFIIKCFDIICQQSQQPSSGNSIGIDINSLVLSLKKIYLSPEELEQQQPSKINTPSPTNTTPTTISSANTPSISSTTTPITQESIEGDLTIKNQQAGEKEIKNVDEKEIKNVKENLEETKIKIENVQEIKNETEINKKEESKDDVKNENEKEDEIKNENKIENVEEEIKNENKIQDTQEDNKNENEINKEEEEIKKEDQVKNENENENEIKNDN